MDHYEITSGKKLYDIGNMYYFCSETTLTANLVVISTKRGKKILKRGKKTHLLDQAGKKTVNF